MCPTFISGEGKFDGNYNVLLLCADPSEPRPGVGAVDMAFVVNVNHGKIVNMTPVIQEVWHIQLNPQF